METLAFDTGEIGELEDFVEIENDEGRPTLWGVSVEDNYEPGWSSRWDNKTPSLLSDGSLWYFESEVDEIEADAPLSLSEVRQRKRRNASKPKVAVTPTIAV